MIMKRIGIIVGAGILLVIVLFGWWVFSRPERGTTGSVSTNFRWLGPNDKIVVDGFDDPKVQGVACHISRAQTGGVKGAMGVAEDTSDAGIACRQNSISTVPIMSWPAPQLCMLPRTMAKNNRRQPNA